MATRVYSLFNPVHHCHRHLHFLLRILCIIQPRFFFIFPFLLLFFSSLSFLFSFFLFFFLPFFPPPLHIRSCNFEVNRPRLSETHEISIERIERARRMHVNCAKDERERENILSHKKQLNHSASKFDIKAPASPRFFVTSRPFEPCHENYGHRLRPFA